MSYLLLLSALLFSVGCDPGSMCASGKDVGDWSVVEASPDAVTTPIVSCGRIVGYDVQVKDGLHTSTMWRAEKAFPGAIGENVRFSVALDSLGVAAEQLRPSIETSTRTEFGFADLRPALSVTADISPRLSPSSGVVRIVQLRFPGSGPYHGRLVDFGW